MISGKNHLDPSGEAGVAVVTKPGEGLGFMNFMKTMKFHDF